MATQRPGFAVPLAEFAAGLLSEREVTPRARLTAHQVVEMLPGAAVVVYVVEDQAAPAWTAKAAEGEIQVSESTVEFEDRKSTRLNSSHIQKSRMPSSA